MRRETKQAAEGGLSGDAAWGRESSVACVMQRRATEAERVELLTMIARVCADVCHWVISCPSEPPVSPHMSVSVPSGQVVAALETRVRPPPGDTDGGQLDAPIQSQPNLERWQRVRVTHPGFFFQLFLCYPPILLPSERSRASHQPAQSSPTDTGSCQRRPEL